MKRFPVKLATTGRGEKKFIEVTGRDVGQEGLAATRPLVVANGEGVEGKSGWVLTHTPSGYVLTLGHWRLKTLALVKEYIEMLEALAPFDWTLTSPSDISLDLKDKGLSHKEISEIGLAHAQEWLQAKRKEGKATYR